MNFTFSVNEQNHLKTSVILQPDDNVDTLNFHEAMIKGAQITKRILTKKGLNKVAVLLSGADGEGIIHYLVNEGINVEAWTLNSDRMDFDIIELSKQICQRYKIKFNQVNVTSKQVFKEIYDLTNITPYKQFVGEYIKTYLLSKIIPKDYYLIGGDGSISRSYLKYDILTRYSPWLEYNFDITNYWYIPMDPYTQSFLQWIIDHLSIHGNFMWYSICYDLWYHSLKSPMVWSDSLTKYHSDKFRNTEFLKQFNLTHSKKTVWPFDYRTQIHLKRIEEYGELEFIVGDFLKINKTTMEIFDIPYNERYMTT